MGRKINLGDLNLSSEKRVLEDAVNQLLEALDLSDFRVFPTVVTIDPNGSLSGKKGQLLTYDTGSALQLKQNTDGGTTWQTIGP